MINSVLSSLPLYYFSIYRAPQKILQQLEKIRRTFLWSGSEDKMVINWVAWPNVILPKENGWLGIGSLKAANLALLARWWWRHKNQSSSLWHKITTSIHHNITHDSLPIRLGIGGTWRAIAGLKQIFAAHGFDLPNACNGEFNSKEIKLSIDRPHGSGNQETVFKWNSWVPKKVNVMNWRASLNRMPTLKSLQARGVNIQTDICSLCN